MLPIARALKTLEEKTGFSQAFNKATEASDNWPARWMTAVQVNHELKERGFWARTRSVVHPDARVRLVAHHLDQLVLQSTRDGGAAGWKRFDGQYKLNPVSKLLDEPKGSNSKRRPQRTSPRTPVAGVSCQYGPVLDMSPVGVRFRSEREADFMTGQKGFIRLKCGAQTVRIKVRILWMQDGIEGLTVGCDFRRLEDEQRALIEHILEKGSQLARNAKAA